MATNRHVHHRRDGIALICTRAWCAPSRWRAMLGCALVVATPFAGVAAWIALGPRRFGIALALLVIAAYVACGTHALGARIEPGAGDERGATRDDARPGAGSAA